MRSDTAFLAMIEVVKVLIQMKYEENEEKKRETIGKVFEKMNHSHDSNTKKIE